MGKHVQRKRYDHPTIAAEQAAEFEHPRWNLPGITLSTEVIQESDGQYWLYVTQEGAIVTGDEPTLPNYEKVG